MLKAWIVRSHWIRQFVFTDNPPFLTGSTIQFTSFSSRWTIFVVFAFSLLINIFYSSWLYAMLAVKITVYPFSGFQSILEDKSYTLGVVDGFSIKTELEVIKSNTVQHRDKWQFHVINSLKSKRESTKRTLYQNNLLSQDVTAFFLCYRCRKMHFGKEFGRSWIWKTELSHPWKKVCRRYVLRTERQAIIKSIVIGEIEFLKPVVLYRINPKKLKYLSELSWNIRWSWNIGYE